MESSIEKDFLKVYNPILTQFIDNIKGLDYKNIAEPFIPAWGSEYEKWEHKLAFVGMDTSNEWGMTNGGLNRWVKYFPLNSDLKKREFLNYNNDEIETLTTWEYGNKSIFIRFIRGFLDAFYNIQNSEQVQNEEKILKSFVYGNVNSFVVPTKAPEGIEVWHEIKKASKIFDKVEHIINAFKPKVIVRLYWDTDYDEYFNSYEGIWNSKEIVAKNEITYYYIKETDTHIYWTKHPRGMSNMTMSFYIYSIIKHIYDKKMFPEFPGQFIIVPIINLISKIEDCLHKLGEQPECDTVDNTYEPFLRIKNICRIYFNPYKVYSEKMFQIKLMVFTSNLEIWNTRKTDFAKKYSHIFWEEPKKTGGWFIVGTKTYKNITDSDIVHFQDYLKSIFLEDWSGIIKNL